MAENHLHVPEATSTSAYAQLRLMAQTKRLDRDQHSAALDLALCRGADSWL